jgi:calpain-7
MGKWKLEEYFRMSWNEACARLDSLYLNWSPNLFRSCLTWHGIWQAGRVQSPSVLVVAKEACDVWLLLTHHVTASRPSSVTWIALHAFDSHEQRDFEKTGVYVDSSHTLVRVPFRPGSKRIVASRQGDIQQQATFTLNVYSLASVTLQEASTIAYPHSYTLKGSWSRKTAGGSVTLPTFLHNPQYLVTFAKQANISITVETSKDIPLQVVMVWSQGKRVDQITRGDVITSSGTYNYGLAMTEARDVKPGVYTLVVSTFEGGQIGDFTIRFESDQVSQMSLLPAEGAGMFAQKIRGSWCAENAKGSPKHSDYFSNPSYEINVDRLSNFILRLQVNDSKMVTLKPQINVAIFTKSSRREIVTSGPYSDAVCGVAIEETKLEAGKYLIVVSTFEPGILVDYTIDVYSDRKIQIA